MLKNNIRLILRNLWKNKVVSAINLLGLTIGIACSLLLLLYVNYEYSYDEFMPDKERIYRLAGAEKGANARKIGLSGQFDAEDLSTNYGNVASLVQLGTNSYDMAAEGAVNQKVRLRSVFASENFFEFFGFPLITGDMNTVLSDPSSIVLTASAAQKLFGDQNPLGKTVIIDNSSFRKDLVVAGIAEDRKDSHIQFEAIIPWEMRAVGGRHFAKEWHQQSQYVYIKTNGAGQIEGITQQKNAALIESGESESWEYFFQPLSEIYMGSNDIQFLDFESGNGQTVQTFLYIAIIILLVACINYVNLQTAKGTRRSLEVGVRKVMGAQKGQLVRQFLSESVVLTVMAALLAVLVVDLVLPSFNNLTGKSFTTVMLIGQGLIPVLITITLITALVAGLYPAFVLSAFRPSEVLKSAAAANLTGKKARRALMLVQFGISIFLMSVTYITFQQTAFIGKKDLGFNKEQVITFNITSSNMSRSYQAFRKELNQYPGIASTSVSTDILGTGETNNSGRVYNKRNAEMKTAATVFGVDHYFTETYDMELVMGKNFDPLSSFDSGALIVNEALVRALALEDPLDSRVAFWNPDRKGYPIIGVVKDFHFRKLHEEINPVIIRIARRNIWHMSVQLKPDNMAQTLDFIDQKWSEFEPERPFSYRFIDQQFARFYENEQRTQTAITVFSLISIVLTALGLFGMTTFVIARKVKEIGIRKVLGASMGHINLLVLKEFLWVFVIALLVATPLAYYTGSQWLDDFAYRISINAIPFVIAAALTLIIIVSTVGLLSTKAAGANPVNALRND